MKRTTTILITICVSALFANGKQISQNAALSAARKYSRTGQVAPAKNLRSDKTNNAPYYAFNLEQGYVIVSGDDEMTELVGYAENGFFDAENVPPQMQLWLDGYAEYVAAVQSGKAKARKILLSDSPSVVVEPLVTTKWNQDAPFNNFAPEYTDDNNNTHRCATGCAATAMAQIMKFHNWPEQGVGYNSYEHQSLGTISSNFSEHVYDWSNMIDRYNNGEYSNMQADAVAFHRGQFVAEETDQQLEEQADLVFGSAPVFLGKGVERQMTDADRAAFGHDGLGGADAGLMSLAAGQAAFLSPAPVAVHDDGDVGRKR